MLDQIGFHMDEKALNRILKKVPRKVAQKAVEEKLFQLDKMSEKELKDFNALRPALGKYKPKAPISTEVKWALLGFYCMARNKYPARVIVVSGCLKDLTPHAKAIPHTGTLSGLLESKKISSTKPGTIWLDEPEYAFLHEEVPLFPGAMNADDFNSFNYHIAVLQGYPAVGEPLSYEEMTAIINGMDAPTRNGIECAKVEVSNKHLNRGRRHLSAADVN